MTDRRERSRVLEARTSAWVALAAVVFAVAVAPPGGGGIPADAAGVVRSGTVVLLDGGASIELGPGDPIVAGSSLEVPRDAATIEVRGGDLSARRGTEIVLGEGLVELDRGALLIESEQTYTIDVGVTLARGNGAWRVDADAQPRVGVYEGGGVVIAQTATGPRALPISPYEQVSLVGGVPAEAAVPLRYAAADPWDQRYLGEALAVDDQLRNVADQLESEYGDGLRSLGFYADFVLVDDALQGALETLAPLELAGRFGPPAPTLIAVVVTQLLTGRAGLSTPEAVTEIATARAAGATWGLILVSHDLDASDLFGALDFALRERREAVAEQADGNGGTAGGPGGGGGSTPSPGDGPSPSPTSPPSPSPSPSPSDPVNDVVDEVEEIIEDIIPPAGDLIDELVPPVRERLGDLLGPVFGLVPRAARLHVLAV